MPVFLALSRILVIKESLGKIRHHADRLPEVELDQPNVQIGDDDPEIARVVIRGTVKENGIRVNKLFFLLFENQVSPQRATTPNDLVCVLVNANGTVLERDDDFWSGIPSDTLEKLGAVDTDGPPIIATAILEFMDEGVFGPSKIVMPTGETSSNPHGHEQQRPSPPR